MKKKAKYSTETRGTRLLDYTVLTQKTKMNDIWPNDTEKAQLQKRR